MLRARVLAVAAALGILVGLTACGGDSSSPSASTSGAAFCRTFERLGSHATPRMAADQLSEVGTPRDMDASARHGLAVLVLHLRDLPDQTKPAEITSMVRNLHAQDGSDVRAFITYYAQECQGFPTGVPS